MTVHLQRRHWLKGAATTVGLAALGPGLTQPAPGQLRMSRTDWPPYIYPQGTGMAGLDVELIDAICAEAQLQLHWEPAVPKRRRRLMLERGELDLIPAATPSDAGRQVSYYSDSYRMEVMAVMALRSELPKLPTAQHYEQLISSQTRLLVPRGSGLDAHFEASRQALHDAGLLEFFDRHHQGMQMLLRHRAPLILGDRPTLFALAREKQLDLVALNFPVKPQPVSLMLSRRSVRTDTLQRINAAIRRLEDQGVLSRIRQQHGLEADARATKRLLSLA